MDQITGYDLDFIFQCFELEAQCRASSHTQCHGASDLIVADYSELSKTIDFVCYEVFVPCGLSMDKVIEMMPSLTGGFPLIIQGVVSRWT